MTHEERREATLLQDARKAALIGRTVSADDGRSLAARAARSLAARSGAPGALVSRTAGLASRTAGILGGATAGRAVASVLGTPALVAGAALGGAAVVKDIVPLVNAAISEALGLGAGPGDALTEQIAKAVQTVFSAVGAAFDATGSTYNQARAAVRLGGRPDVVELFKANQAVAQAQSEARAKFDRSIGADLARQVVRAARGQGG